MHPKPTSLKLMAHMAAVGSTNAGAMDYIPAEVIILLLDGEVV